MQSSERMEVPFRHSLRAKLLVGLMLALAMMLVAVLVVFYLRGYELLMARERDVANAAAQHLASDMSKELALAEGVAVALANLGERLPHDEALWRAVIPGVLDLDGRSELITGGGLWPEPDAFTPGVARRSFFWGRDDNGVMRYFDGYNAAEGHGYHGEEWYVPARYQREGHCYWSRSYQDPYSGEKMVTCTAAMHVAKRFVGVSTVDLKLSGLQDFLDRRGDALKGYAFAIDRNGVFITVPPIQRTPIPDGTQIVPDGIVFGIADFASHHADFSALADFLNQPLDPSGDSRQSDIAHRIDQATDAIDQGEAERIAAQILDSGAAGDSVRQTTLPRDPFLKEASLVTVVRLPSSHWQLVVVQPARLVHEAVMSVMTRVAWALGLAVVVVVLLAGWLLRRTLVLPIRRITEQLAATEHSIVPGRIEVHGRDELAQLARTFNRYAEQIAENHADLHASAEQFRTVTELAHDALIQVDDDSRIISVNHAGEQMFGWEENELVGEEFKRLVPWDPRGASFGEHDGVAASRAASQMLELTAQHRDGHAFPAEVSVSYWRGPSHGLYNVQVRDVTERQRADARMRMLATHDTLTGLPNRTLFNDRLKRAVERCLLESTAMALLFLDLDHFKVANDSLGHSVGDTLLRAVGERLQDCVRPGDTIARLGGDEFAMLMPNLSEAADAARMAQRIIDCIGDVFEVDGHHLQIGVSIGVTLCPGDDRHAEQLLRKADLAMYHAKAEGRNTFRFFTERLHAELVERKAMLDQLAHAIVNHEFELHYQPVLATANSEFHGIEALIRWRHPTLGLVTPERFVPLAEQSGLIVTLGHWIIEQSIADLASWDAAGLPQVRLAINLSLAQFRDPALVERLQAALAHHRVAAARVELELTETVLMHDLDDAIEIMARLRALGLGLAVDDFGTGYSSLSYLKRFPVQKLKIDKSFVRGVADDKDSAAICRSVIALGHNLGLNLVGEGVENLSDLNWLRQHRCDYIQGYYISTALPMPALRQWWQQRPQEPRSIAAEGNIAID
ncbi:MAG TPA: EAL domain-containing protein [Pseudomonadota bacterium]|nr:EAL domain-containing protein [Xanthomonadales bacterium]HQW81636.1 EAL domain-containing protein [Pseudomonadota bacterium]